ncbi:hypothetical protein [Deinococcus sp. DB0503]|uniref:hypothetical protein n=1 Tax=Deinococcus sp. DB0503 TaxID=2479203 RepID=UPI0018DF29BF|nr:hypothetical protein [Deinococcus sp. DB0503]
MGGLSDLTHLLWSVLSFGLFAVVFAGSGLLVGVFLPGNILLITAGLLAQPGSLHLGA